MFQTPWKTDAFDFFDLQGTRLTATSLSEQFESTPHQEHGFYSYFLHLEVSDLSTAKQWYSSFLGMIPVELPDSGDYLMMRMQEDEQIRFPIYLSGGHDSRNSNRTDESDITAVRPFFQVAGKPQLENTYTVFKSNDLEVSEITGNQDDFMRWFDFSDPKGIRLYAIAY